MPRYEKGGAVAWAARWWRALLSEVCATALLVWLGVGSSLPMEANVAIPLTHVACAFGFVVVGCCVAFGPSSGAHMNPALTLAAALAGRIAWTAAAAYVLAQLLGAVIGFGALLATLPVTEQSGVTLPTVSPIAATALEAALTGLLTLVCCNAWATHDPARPDAAMPIKLGLVIAGLVYAGGPATGASLNPARSFAPALLQGCWKHHWVYWVGPVGGAIVAALLHRVLQSTVEVCGRAEAGAEAEAVPLDDKP